MSTISERFRILSPLGVQKRRKFGHVFLAEDRISRERVVLKYLNNASSEKFKDRFEHEAIFSFDLPGLQKTLAFEETQGELFLVKSYLEGIPLQEYWNTIPRSARLSELIRILEALLPIFEYLSSENIAHCDIKPSNILIAKSTEGPIKAGLIDFGLAIRHGRDLKYDYKMVFPLGFAAPELLLNTLYLIDHTTDLYALGITIWRLFTGSLPLTHPNPSIFTNLQLTHPLPDHDALPKGLYPILLKMCFKHQFNTAPNLMDQKEVEGLLVAAQHHRYQSLNEILADIKKIPPRKRFLLF